MPLRSETMDFGVRRVRLVLYLFLLSTWSMFQGTHSNCLSHAVFVEMINPLESGLVEARETNQSLREECSQFFSSYFSGMFESELKGYSKTDFLASVKHSFLRWVDHSKHVQILSSTDHVLTPLEKSLLIKNFRESDFQSLIITENYIIYKIFFRDLNQNLVFNVLNTCDILGPNNVGTGFETDIAALDPKERELVQLDSLTIGDQIILEIEEQNSGETSSIRKTLNDYLMSGSLFKSKSPEKHMETDQHTSPEDDPLRVSIEASPLKDLEGTFSSYEKSKKLPSETDMQMENKDGEEERKAVVDRKEEFKENRKLEDGVPSSTGRKRENLRAERKRKPYKKVRSSHFYVDTRPVVSNQVYLYEKRE